MSYTVIVPKPVQKQLDDLYQVPLIAHNCNAVKTRVSVIYIMGDLPDIILPDLARNRVIDRIALLAEEGFHE